jgi:lysophospholipase L1-like esterase
MIRTRLGRSWIAVVVAALFLGCSAEEPQAPEIAPPESPMGMGALGNSLTAGFINAGLIRGGQEASFPNLIAQQALGHGLQMPLVAEPGIGSTPGLSALYVNEEGKITADPVADPTALLLNATYPIPYDNLAVPGATTQDLLQATDATTSQSGTNAFFDAILRNANLPPGGKTALDQMAALKPDLLTLWIGNNDILGGALSGDPEIGVNVTPLDAWQQMMTQIFDRVEAMGARYVAVANIPGIPTIPYFTTVPLGVAVDTFFVRWRMEENEDGDPDTVKLVLLSAPVTDPDSAAHYLPPPFGIGDRILPSSLTLTESEVNLLNDQITAFNDFLAQEVPRRGWAYVDVYSELAGLPDDPGQLGMLNAIFPWIQDPDTGEYFQNEMSAFSLDGIHPSERGHARLANVFIQALNATYGLDIPQVDEASVHNVVGFERAPAKSLGTFIDPEARRALSEIRWLFTGTALFF